MVSSFPESWKLDPEGAPAEPASRPHDIPAPAEPGLIVPVVLVPVKRNVDCALTTSLRWLALPSVLLASVSLDT